MAFQQMISTAVVTNAQRPQCTAAISRAVTKSQVGFAACHLQVSQQKARWTGSWEC